MNEKELPEWVLGFGRIDESKFCKSYLERSKLAYHGGAFFTVDGKVNDEMALRRDIYSAIAEYVPVNPGRRVESILSTLKLEAYKDDLAHQELVIHVGNGAYHLDEGYISTKKFCRYRLPVNYNADAPEPKLWLQFLSELLEPEDIRTLQEYMGYCLLPVTYGQKMLLIIGKGGEGKSRIGVVMKALLGNNMNQGSLAKVETSPFARADLEHVLVMVDDDLKMEALTQTNHIKSIVTAENPMDLERKGIQSYQGKIFARFMAFGNGNLQALHDRSYGFFRRQIILTTKERSPDRVDDPYLGKRLTKEAEGIFLWCLEGLERLIDNDFRFSISQRTRENMSQAMYEGNNILEFMESDGYFRFDPDGRTPFRALYNAYRDWCDDNAAVVLSAKSFGSFLQQNQQRYDICYTNAVPIGNGRRGRGYLGIRLCPRY